MSDNFKTRAERREEQREQRKTFDSVAKELRNQLASRADDDFKQAILSALKDLEMSDSDNKLTAAVMIGGCIDCERRKDEAAARLLLYTAGVIVEPHLTVYALRTLMSAQQMIGLSSAVQVPPKQ